MNEIISTITALLPSKRRSTPSGWIGFNAVCCHHNGESMDNRGRGGVLFSSNGGFNYHCFNCNFKTGWTPGIHLGENARKLFTWLGLSDTDIGKLNVVALKLKDAEPRTQPVMDFDIKVKSLPELSLPLEEWRQMDLPAELQEPIDQITSYITETRGFELNWYPWHWSAADGFRDRVLIPFYHQGQIVGYTGRKIVDGKPKYLTETSAGYVFNLDRQTYDRKYVIVVEGQFDAIAIDGCAVAHNQVHKTQATRIKNLNKEVVVVPDRDRAGAQLVESALDEGWSVSSPPWEEHVKDVADAVKAYGRLYTLSTILHYRETNPIKIQLLKKKLESKGA